MFRNRISIIAMASAVVAIGVAVRESFTAIKSAIVAAVSYHWAEACAMAAPRDGYENNKPGLLVKAKAFKKSLMKRDKPLMSQSWRMCSST